MIFIAAAAPAFCSASFKSGPLLTEESIFEIRWMPDSSGVAATTGRGMTLVAATATTDLLFTSGDLSPDGRSIIYSDPTADYLIKIKFLDNPKPYDIGIIGTGPKWSPDGGKIVFYSAPKGCGSPVTPQTDPTAKCPPSEISTAEFKTNTITPILAGFDAGDSVAWLADSSGLLYYRDGEFGVTPIKSNANSVADVNEPFPPVNGKKYAPDIISWQSATTTFAATFLYTKTDRKAANVWSDEDAVRLAVFDAKTLKPVFRDRQAWFINPKEADADISVKGISVSADGNQLAYAARDKTGFFLRLTAFSGGTPINYRFPGGVPILPAWSPDGNFLAYAVVTYDYSSPINIRKTAQLFISRVAPLPAAGGK